MQSVYRGILIGGLIFLLPAIPVMFARGNIEVGVILSVLGILGIVYLVVERRLGPGRQ